MSWTARGHDAIRFLRKLSVRKVYNALLLVTSFYFSKWTGKVRHWGMPMAISFEPTTACNLKCPECPSGLRSFTRETGNLKSDIFRKTINDIADDLASLTFYFQGEPYINPEFLDMVKYAHEKRIYTVTSTNGHFLNDKNCKKTIESGLDRIIISIDGTTQEVYEQYRKEGDLLTVLQGARNLVKWKKELKRHHPYIIFQFLVVAPNEHQIEEVQRLADDIGVDEVKFKSAQLYDFEKGHPLMPTNERYARYVKQSDGTYRTKHALTNACWKTWHSCVITWNGTVVPCCFDKDALNGFGTTKTSTFANIWKGENAQIFRQSVFQDRKSIEICSNCTEGCSIWV